MSVTVFFVREGICDQSEQRKLDEETKEVKRLLLGARGINAEPRVQAIWFADNTQGAWLAGALKREEVDVVVFLSQTDVDAANQLKEVQPDVRVVLLTDLPEDTRASPDVKVVPKEGLGANDATARRLLYA